MWIQLQDERLAVIDRDNRLMASRLAHIGHSKGLVDHQNLYRLRRLEGFLAANNMVCVSSHVFTCKRYPALASSV